LRGGVGFTKDNSAFVFNLNDKFIPSNYDKAIDDCSNGFGFGNAILAVLGDQLNADYKGWCRVDTDRFYNISADS
jgi:hypothetical protein